MHNNNQVSNGLLASKVDLLSALHTGVQEHMPLQNYSVTPARL